MAGIRNLYSELLKPVRGRGEGTRYKSSYTFFTGKDLRKNTPRAATTTATTTTTARQKGEVSLHRRTHRILLTPSLHSFSSSSSSHSVRSTAYPNSRLPLSSLCPRRPISSSPCCRKPLQRRHLFAASTPSSYLLPTSSAAPFSSVRERRFSPSHGSSFYLPPVDHPSRQCLSFFSCCSSCSPSHHGSLAIRSSSSSLWSALPGSSDREFRKEGREKRGFQSEASWRSCISPSSESSAGSGGKCDDRGRHRESQREHDEACIRRDPARTSFSTTGEMREKRSTIHKRESSCSSPRSHNGAYDRRHLEKEFHPSFCHQDSSRGEEDLTAWPRSSGRRDGGERETGSALKEEKLSSDLPLDLRQQKNPRNGEAEKESISTRNVQIGPGTRESSAGRGERTVLQEGGSSSKINSASSPRASSRGGGLPPPSPSPLIAPPTTSILRSKLSGPRAQLQVCIIEPVLETSPLPPSGEGLYDNGDVTIPTEESSGTDLKENKKPGQSSSDQASSSSSPSSSPLSPSLSDNRSEGRPSTTPAPSLVEEDGEPFLRNMRVSSSPSPRTPPRNRVCRKLYYRCRYTSISRSQLAASLQLPYSDIRLVDVVRPPTIASAGPSTSSSGGAERPTSSSHFSYDSKKRTTHGSGVKANARHAFSVYEFLKRLFSRDPKSDVFSREERGQPTYQQKTSAKSDPSKRDEGRAEESFVEERERGCGEGGDLFGLRFDNHLRDGPKPSIFHSSASDIGLGGGPFLANLDALKLQHAKILVRRTAILVQIENIAAVLTPDRLLLLHPHPSIMSAILQQLSSDECTAGGGVSSHGNNSSSSVYGGDYYTPRKGSPEGQHWGSSSRCFSDVSSPQGSSSPLMDSPASSSSSTAHCLTTATSSTSQKEFKGIRSPKTLGSGDEEDDQHTVDERGTERQLGSRDTEDVRITKESKVQRMGKQVVGMGNKARGDSKDPEASTSSDEKKRRFERLSGSSALLETPSSVLDENKQLSEEEEERGMKKTTDDPSQSSRCKSSTPGGNQTKFSCSSSSNSSSTSASCRLSPSTSSCLQSSRPAPTDTGGGAGQL